MILMFNRWRTTAAVLASAVVLASAGCAAAPATAEPSDGKLQVMASIYPLMYVTQQIAGTYADVSVLTPIGTEPHDYDPTPQQMAALSKATLVVYQAGVDAAVDDMVAQANPAHTIETGALVPKLLPATDDGDPDGPPGYTSTYEYNPHTWLDPTNMIRFGDAIATELAKLDPADAAGYQANQAAFTAQMNQLDEQFTTGLAHCNTNVFMTTHAAFGYFAQRYGLTQLAIAGVSPDDEPSPMHMGELAVQAQQHHLTTVFFETMVSPAYADTLAYDLGLRTDVLDPIEGVTSASRGTNYLQIMQSNLKALQQADGCTS